MLLGPKNIADIQNAEISGVFPLLSSMFQNIPDTYN
jgi:hypothetical protein